MSTPPRLTAGQAAARLDVKVETLYAYVSRGLISRQRDARGSSFDALEVEAFAVRRRRSQPPPQTGSPGRPLMVLDTDVALLEDDELYFRGVHAARLARDHPFDAVAAWLWEEAGVALDDTRRLAAPVDFVRSSRRILGALPHTAPLLDRLVVAVRAFAIADPLRDGIGRDALARVGEILLAGIPDALGGHPIDTEPVDATPELTVPARVWRTLTGAVPSAVELSAINAAMVLSIDHDLAASTFAGRIAASARASPYAVVTAALGAFDSPLHGTASTAAAKLIAAVRDGESADVAIRAVLRGSGRGVPGFGQQMYRTIDARAAALLPLVRVLDVRTADAVAALTETMIPTGLRPNVDLALGALAVAAGMPVDAGALIFAVARTAGWIAHAIAEEAEPPLRLRPRGRYVGPL